MFHETNDEERMRAEATNFARPRELTSLHREYCVRVAVKLRCQSPEDCAQDALCHAIEHLNEFRGTTEAAFHAWLKKIVTNSYLNLVRDRKARKRTPNIVTESPTQNGTAPSGSGASDVRLPTKWPVSPESPESPSTPPRRAEETAQLQGLVANLTPDEQSVIRLKFFEGLTFKEIAERMGKPPATVYWIYRKALSNLQPQTSLSQWSKLL